MTINGVVEHACCWLGTLVKDACEDPHTLVGLKVLSPSDLQVFPHPVKTVTSSMHCRLEESILSFSRGRLNQVAYHFADAAFCPCIADCTEPYRRLPANGGAGRRPAGRHGAPRSHA